MPRRTGYQPSGFYIGIGYTEGEALTTVDGFADGAVEVVEALGLSHVDLLGWSFGGSWRRKSH